MKKDNQYEVEWEKIKKDLLDYIKEVLKLKELSGNPIILKCLKTGLRAALDYPDDEYLLYLSVCAIGNLWDYCKELNLFPEDTIEKMYNHLGNYRVNYRGIAQNWSTGFKEIDSISGGIKKGELTVIVAHTGTGKSLLSTDKN